MKKLYHGHNLHECQYIYERCVFQEPIIKEYFTTSDDGNPYQVSEERDCVYINVIYRHINNVLHGGFIICTSDGWVTIAIEPELRNMGVGSTLVERLQKEMHLVKLNVLQWSCDRRNIASYKLALSKGFVLINQDRKYYVLNYFRQ